MRKGLRSLLLAGAAALALLAAGCAKNGDVGNRGISVMLCEGEGFTIVSRNPVVIQPGEKARFQVEMPDTSVCIQIPKNATFNEEKKILTIKDVQYPTTVKMRVAEDPAECKFFLENSGNGGYVGSDVVQGMVYEGTVAQAYVRVKPEFRFDGWSLKHSLSKGGKLISTNETIEYTVTENTFLYANFTRVVEEKKNESSTIGNTQLFTYHANGGAYAGTTVEVVNMEVGIDHLYQNCLPAKDYFVREGYQLIEYNTAPDGSGQGYSLGSKVLVPKDEAVLLYCIWAKESDPSYFTCEPSGAGVAITGYTADEDTVVIPETIDGRKVVRIKTGAFTDKHFSTMVIPKSVLNVESAAFGCTSAFETLYMYDTMLEIPNDAFTDMSGFTNFRLNASMDPVYTNSTEGCFSIKWERIVASDKPVIVVLSGSSSLYGFNGAMFQSFVGEDYTVVNYGTNAGVSSLFYMEVLSHFLEEGDILIHAPEIGGQTMGSGSITWRLFRGTEYYYNVWRYVDMRRYTDLFKEYTEFQKTRLNMNPLDYTKNTTSMNEYGDINNTAAYNAEDYHAGSTFYFNVGTISGQNKDNLNWVYQELMDRGVTVYMSCAPSNRNAVYPAHLDRAVQDAYMASIRESVIVPVISHVGDYILPGELMYNSDYHPNMYGRDMRTEQLFADFKAQIEKDGIVIESMEADD